MKILQVHWGSQYMLGGVERIVQRLAARLDECDHQVTTVGIYNFGLRRHKAPVSGKFIGIPYPNIHRSRFKPVLERSFSVFAAPFALKADAVLGWGPQGLPASFLAPMAYRLTNPFQWTDESAHRRLSPARRASMIIVETEAGRDFMLEKSPWLEGRIDVIPGGVDMPSDVRPLKGRPRRVVSVGRLDDPRKGMPDLIKAFRRVVNEVPEATLRILGAGDPSACQAAIAETKLEASVSLLRREDSADPEGDLDRAYREADLFALHTRRETFGLVFAEAMSYGLPIVATRGDEPQGRVIDEVVADNRAGAVTQLGDRRAFADALIGLMAQPERAEDISIRNMATAQARYDWSTVTSQYVATLEYVANRGRLPMLARSA